MENKEKIQNDFISLNESDAIKALKRFNNILVDSVYAGKVNPVNAFLFLKQVEKNAAAMRDLINDLTIDELYKVGEESKEYKIGKCSLSLKSSAGRWDFSNIKEVGELEQELKDLKLKHIAAYKGSLNDSFCVSADGEVLVPAVFKKGKEIIAVKIK